MEGDEGIGGGGLAIFLIFTDSTVSISNSFIVHFWIMGVGSHNWLFFVDVRPCV